MSNWGFSNKNNSSYSNQSKNSASYGYPLVSLNNDKRLLQNGSVRLLESNFDRLLETGGQLTIWGNQSKN